MAKQARPGRPRDQQADTLILDTAMQLLVEQGYGGLTLDKVAARAGVSKSTIYRRWHSKQHLVIAAFDTSPPLQGCDKGDLIEELFSLMKQFLGILKTTPLGGVLPTLIGERARDPELSSALDPMIKARRKPIRDCLQRGVDRGDLPEGTNLELAVDMVMGPIIMRTLFAGKNMTQAQLRDSLLAALRGLGAKS